MGIVRCRSPHVRRLPFDLGGIDCRIGSRATSDRTGGDEHSLYSPYEDITPRYIDFERDYLVTMLLSRLERIQEARRMIDQLAAEEEFQGVGSMQHDAILALRAEIAYKTGEHEETLKLLRQIEYEVPHAAAYRLVADGARSRLLRAQLEQTIGDPLAAWNYYQGIDTSWSPWDTPYRPFAYLGMAQLAEADGRIDEAVIQYSRLLDLWGEADDEVVEELDRLRARRDSLKMVGQ